MPTALSDDVAHTALAAFALLLANHIGDDTIVHEAVAAGETGVQRTTPRHCWSERRPAKQGPIRSAARSTSLRKIIEIKPVPTLPGALTS